MVAIMPAADLPILPITGPQGYQEYKQQHKLSEQQCGQSVLCRFREGMEDYQRVCVPPGCSIVWHGCPSALPSRAESPLQA